MEKPAHPLLSLLFFFPFCFHVSERILHFVRRRVCKFPVPFFKDNNGLRSPPLKLLYVWCYASCQTNRSRDCLTLDPDLAGKPKRSCTPGSLLAHGLLLAFFIFLLNNTGSELWCGSPSVLIHPLL